MAADTSAHIHDAPPSLALALIACSTAPLVLLDAELSVIAASTSFCACFQIDPQKVVGRSFFEIGNGEWNAPRLHSLLNATASVGVEIDAYEADIEQPRGPRRVVLNARRITYVDADRVRLLLAVTDVTDIRIQERLHDNLLREKTILLQEVQHRVANSLQIIASVILQSARKVQSGETRVHLHDAHQRVMSVAAVQQQLSQTGLQNVEVRSYLNRLCESIGASMIHDHDQLSIKVTVHEGSVRPEASISLGLMVTELVINALKHAYPDHRRGTIWVGYSAQGPNWTLSVRDDGVGMPKDPEAATPGLGTSIINALAEQMKAEVQVLSLHPGTQVSIVHAQVAALAGEQTPKSRTIAA
jgi:two-component system, sensor histidine kinase PdtaS